jgi:hypothetical protein
MYCIVKYDHRKEQSICIAYDPDLNTIRELCVNSIDYFVNEKNKDKDNIPMHIRYSNDYHTCYVYRQKEVINKGWIYNSYVYDTETLYSYNISCVSFDRKPYNIRITPSSNVFNKNNLFKSKVKSVQLIDELNRYFIEKKMLNIE